MAYTLNAEKTQLIETKEVSNSVSINSLKQQKADVEGEIAKLQTVLAEINAKLTEAANLGANI